MSQLEVYLKDIQRHTGICSTPHLISQGNLNAYEIINTNTTARGNRSRCLTFLVGRRTIDLPGQSGMLVHPGFELLIFLLDFLKAFFQLHIFFDLSFNETRNSVCSLQIKCRSYQVFFFFLSFLTSFSICISFWSCWWSCWILMSRTTLRLSNSCSRYKVCGSF